MGNNLSKDYKGLDLPLIAHSIDELFGFPSDWESRQGTGGSWEFEGRIVVDLDETDRLGEVVEAGPVEIANVFRYVFAHLKAHHYQELNPTYEKTYLEDIRPHELDADLVAGWVCAHAEMPSLFRLTGMASSFNDFNRRARISPSRLTSSVCCLSRGHRLIHDRKNPRMESTRFRRHRQKLEYAQKDLRNAASVIHERARPSRVGRAPWGVVISPTNR